ncbi:MAG: F0F1 ATP synthase subunit delta [Oscillospiraceae bacterium]|nr:F0F1 ATP synthase subunit delta [Oscillospiraceae bacterium]MBQ8379020.1 F0F1 ATP synthase subunit delta [Oscillospiraceae bacterium]MBQ8883636.1 F0F1 ATP synthase subunit delta [Oscillospiraceae bacterium]
MAGKLEKVYADALFELAVEDNTLDTVAEEMEAVAGIMSENSDFLKLLSAPTVSDKDKKSMLSKAFEGRISDTVFNFINVLCDNGRIKYLIAISQQFKDMYNDKNGILEVIVTTTMPLSDNLREKLVLKLEKISSKKIQLVEKIDTSIMGGIVLNYNNTQIDASVKKRLDTMRQQIDSIIA